MSAETIWCSIGYIHQPGVYCHFSHSKLLDRIYPPTVKKKKLEILCQNLILLFIGQNKKKERKKIWGNKVHVQLNNVLHMLASSCSLRMFVLLLTTLRMLWISFYPVLFANVTCLTSSGSWVWDLWKSLIISYTISF